MAEIFKLHEINHINFVFPIKLFKAGQNFMLQMLILIKEPYEMYSDRIARLWQNVTSH